MICEKCYNRGKIYRIDGSLTTVNACDCEVAKEQQQTYAIRTDKLKNEIDNIIATLQNEG